MEVGGWVQVSNFFFFKSSQNIPKPVLMYFGVVYHVFSVTSVCIHQLLKVVGYCDLSVLSMSVSVMGFQQKSLDGCELYPSFFWIFGICLTLQSP